MFNSFGININLKFSSAKKKFSEKKEYCEKITILIFFSKCETGIFDNANKFHINMNQGPFVENFIKIG